jgi:SAM-dependent methyltransferase
MRLLDAIEESIWNVGERLIPGVTHNRAEVVRHKSSYQFFRKVIENDLLSGYVAKSGVSILDIGCGVGHGAYLLADIPGARVTAIDSSNDAILYARSHYGRENLNYHAADAITFIKSMPEFDYVVSRHSLEHIPEGIAFAAECRFGARLMVNVPFEEPEGNPHHHVHFIREESFEKYPNREFFYEDLEGITFCDFPFGKTANSIVCVSSRNELPGVATQLSFPLPAWRPEFLQGKWLEAVDRQSDLDTLLQQQSNRDLELAGRETVVVNRESDAARREADLSVRESQVGMRESEVVSRESELTARESQQATREADLATRESRAAIRETELGVREGQLAARTQELGQLESKLNQRSGQLLEQRSELEGLIRTFESRVFVRAYRKIRRLL